MLASIPTSGEVKNLGSWFDSSLSMSSHVTKIASSCFYFIYNIRRIRKYLTQNACETLVNALVTSRLDYCNSLLYGHLPTLLARLQRVHNSATRLIYNTSRFSPTTPLLYQLQWLSVKYRNIFKILIITYKAINSLAPDYIKELIHFKQSLSSLRSTDEIILDYPSFKSSKTLGDRSFSIAAPTEWNRLPPKIRKSPSLDIFKKLLKTHLFSIAFEAHTRT